MRKHTIRKGAKRHTEYATIAIIGKTGTGKSTIANTFLQGNDDDKPEVFQASASVNACTFDCKNAIGTLLDQGRNPL